MDSVTGSESEHPVDPPTMDRTYFLMRAAALVVGALYAYITPAQQVSDDVLIAFAAFAAYGTVFYVAGYRAMAGEYNRIFYAALGAADLIFVVWLMHLTGAQDSPFFRALYLWVAMPAFYFGLRTGSLASAVAFCTYAWFFPPADDNLWTFFVKSGGILLHGPLIGYLVERDRRHILALQQANAALQQTLDRLRSAGSQAS